MYGYRILGVPYTKTVSLVYGVGWLEERSDDALFRATAVPGILPPGKIVEGEKAAGVYEGAAPKMLKKYIKADSLEVVEKLTDKYEYFR